MDKETFVVGELLACAIKLNKRGLIIQSSSSYGL